MNRLRDLDPQGTLLKKVAGQWPPITASQENGGLEGVPITQWKAYDKLERTLMILVVDHDAGDTPSPLPSRPRWLFDKLFGYVRGPNSGSEIEKCAALQSSHYGMVAFNVGDHNPDEWVTWKIVSVQHNLTPILWARCHTIVDVLRLRAQTETFGTPGLIVNLEQEDGSQRWLTSGAQVATALKGYTGQIGLSTEPWMPDNFDWAPLVAMGAVALPQTSMAEFSQFPPKVAVARAKQFGFTDPVPSFATYRVGVLDQKRSQYDWNKAFGIYTVDDLQPQQIPQWV